MSVMIEKPAASREFRARREAAGLTQRDLASLGRVSMTSICNWEAGVLPTRKSVALDRVLGVLDDFEKKDGAVSPDHPVQRSVEQDRRVEA